MIFLKKILIIIFLCITLMYVTNITNIPESVILFENEELNLGEILGITVEVKESKTIQAVSKSSNNIESKTVQLKLFNLVNIKQVEIDTIKNVKVVPLGNTIGIKLYSDGVLVIGMTEVEGKKPYENTGIKEGDLIISVDNVEVSTTEKLIECVNKCKGNNIEIKYIREGVEYVTHIEPVKTSEDDYKIGLWVRDGAVGIGTATYYEPESGKIATLGHGILDRDTDKLITIESGEITTSVITKIKKGKKDNPGEIKGMLNDDDIIGNIYKNTEYGVYGNLFNTNELGVIENNSLEVALKDEIKTGNATILLTLEDGIRKEYDIKIKKIYKYNNDNNKSMLIEIIDEELIKKTGGIIQRNEWSTNNTKWEICTEL